MAHLLRGPLGRIGQGLLLLAALHLQQAARGQSVDLCDLAGGSGAMMARHGQNPMTILNAVVIKAGWQPDDFTLVPTMSDKVKGNAAAEVCVEPRCNCIFYDPRFLPASPPSGDESWISYFMLAHEAGHIIKPSNGKTRAQKEAAADDWAGWALEKLDAPIEGVLAGVDYVANSEDESVDYHGRCRRRMDALAGYNRAAGEEGKPRFEGCQECFASSSRGLFVTQDVTRGTAIGRDMVVQCGSGKSGDFPTDYDKDIRGACFLADRKKGERVTWYNIGLCSR